MVVHSVAANRAVVVCGAIWQPWWAMSGGPLDVVGIGNAIVDVLSHADDEFLVREGLVKGSMALIDTVRAEALYDSMGPAIEVSGGSAANTVAGLAGFGGRAGFVGRVRDDQLGAVFTHDLRALGVEFDVAPATEGPPTGRCLILVTPDAQRTLNTYLGAAPRPRSRRRRRGPGRMRADHVFGRVSLGPPCRKGGVSKGVGGRARVRAEDRVFVVRLFLRGSMARGVRSLGGARNRRALRQRG